MVKNTVTTPRRERIALVGTILDRIATPLSSIWIGKDYDLTELREDLREVMRLCESV